MDDQPVFHRCATPDCLRKIPEGWAYCCPTCERRRLPPADGPQERGRINPRTPLHSWQCDMDMEARGGEFKPGEEVGGG